MKTITPSSGPTTSQDSILDRPIWHSEDPSYPSNLPEENAATHIGMYIAWFITNFLESDALKEDNARAIEDLRSRKITGREFLASNCDDIFMLTDLNPDGRAFTEAYYKQNYFQDFIETFSRENTPPFEVENSWANYELIADTLCEAYKQWKAPSLVAAYSHWWQFWR
tara:strand:+ start:949 stop:1452 length:504 start_codon:yes stop_codon:yes gene_type:complete